MTGDDLRALSAAATPGPWVGYKYGVTATDRDGTLYEPCGDYQDDMRYEDKELIVWLRNHADALAALIDAADALVQPAGWWGGVEQRQEHQLLDRRAVVRDALAALDGTP